MEFPSPYGDVVLKLKLSRVDIPSELLVSVPLRGCGFEIHDQPPLYRVLHQFPSPYGDVVLKFEEYKDGILVNRIVSVPLRGCGFEIKNDENNAFWNNVSFRPLTGMWF